MPTFKFEKREPILIGKHHSLEEAHAAIQEQLSLIEQERTTARASMRYLLKSYPILRKDRRGSLTHPLTPLVQFYVDEMLAPQAHLLSSRQ